MRSIAHSMPVSKPPSLAAPFEQREQRLDVGGGHRTPIGAARERRDDLPGAAVVVGRPLHAAGSHTKIRRRLGLASGRLAP